MIRLRGRPLEAGRRSFVKSTKMGIKITRFFLEFSRPFLHRPVVFTTTSQRRRRVDTVIGRGSFFHIVCSERIVRMDARKGVRLGYGAFASPPGLEI